MQSPAQNVVPDPTPQLVFQALSAIASGDSSADVPLKTWEADAAPGFLGLLVEVVGRPEEVNEVRLDIFPSARPLRAPGEGPADCVTSLHRTRDLCLPVNTVVALQGNR